MTSRIDQASTLLRAAFGSMMASLMCEADSRSPHQRDKLPITSTNDVPPKEPSMSAITLADSGTTTAVSELIHTKSFLPIVIPQTSRSLRGVHFSPFLRAYPTSLAPLGISQTDFIKFIDDLNEAFISSPLFYALTVVGSAVSFIPELAAQITGSVVATVSSLIGLANSKLRTKLYVKTANKDIFELRGLQVRILDMEKMLEMIHVDQEAFQLPPLPENVPDTFPEDDDQEDPRRRWLQALDSVIAPLEYLPTGTEFTEQPNWLKKASAWSAKQKDKQQAKTLTKRRDKAKKAVEAAEEEALTTQQGILNTIEDLQAELYALNVQRTDDSDLEAQRRRNITDHEDAIRTQEIKLVDVEIKLKEATEKAIGKVDKKEKKIVQKIRWLVITVAETDAESVADEDIDDGVEDVQSL